MSNIKSVTFKNHSFLIPDNDDYEYYFDEHKMVLEYKKNRIAVIMSIFDVIRIDSIKCSITFKSKTVFLIKALDDLQN